MPPGLQHGKRQRSAYGDCSVMGSDVAPRVQLRKMRQARYVRRVSRQVEPEAKTLEILPDVLEVRVAVVEFQLGGELGLDQRLEGKAAHPGNDNLGRFRVEITAEALKMRAEQHNVPP